MGCIVYNHTVNLCYLIKIGMTVPALGFLYVPHDYDKERDIFEPHVKLGHIFQVPFPKSRSKQLVPAAQIEIDKAHAAGEFQYEEDMEPVEPEPLPPEPEPEEPPEEDGWFGRSAEEGDDSEAKATTQSTTKKSAKKK